MLGSSLPEGEGFIEEVAGEHTAYKLARKGAYFLIELRRIEEFLAAFGFAL